MKEIWKDIPNYNGYQVSNYGKVRTFNKTTYTKKHGVRHWKNRILKQKIQTRKNGRKDCRVDLWNNGNHKTILVARLVAFTFYNKDINSSMTVDHLDCNSLNNNLSNLQIVDLKENIKRAYKNGIYCKKIKVIDKFTNKENIFVGMNKASKFINQHHGYISEKVKKQIYENKRYKWSFVE